MDAHVGPAASAAPHASDASSTPQARTAVITGAGSGIGRATARSLAGLGHRVAVLDRDVNAARETVQLISDAGGRGITVATDVSVSTDVQRAVCAVVTQLGPPEILVNNAGFAKDSVVTEMTLEDWDAVVDTHLRGTFLMTRAVAPFMVENSWGRIVNISSISARQGAGRSNYSAAKAGIEAFTRSVATELAPHRITVNAIGPGLVVTQMTEVTAARAGRSLEEHLDVVLGSIGVGRLGAPRDIARVVEFFADEESDYITGQLIYVSGTAHG